MSATVSNSQAAVVPSVNESYPLLDNYVLRIARSITTGPNRHHRFSSNAIKMVALMLWNAASGVANAASAITQHAHRITMTPADIRTAISILFPGSMSRIILDQESRTFRTYRARNTTEAKLQRRTERERILNLRRQAAPNEEVPKLPRLTHSEMADIEIPISRVTKMLKKQHPNNRLASGTALAVASFMDFMAAEILENAMILTYNDMRVTVRSKDLLQGIRDAPKLERFFNCNVTSEIQRQVEDLGGVPPKEPPAPKRRKKVLKAAVFRPRKSKAKKAAVQTESHQEES